MKKFILSILLMAKFAYALDGNFQIQGQLINNATSRDFSKTSKTGGLRLVLYLKYEAQPLIGTKYNPLCMKDDAPEIITKGIELKVDENGNFSFSAPRKASSFACNYKLSFKDLSQFGRSRIVFRDMVYPDKHGEIRDNKIENRSFTRFEFEEMDPSDHTSGIKRQFDCHDERAVVETELYSVNYGVKCGPEVLTSRNDTAIVKLDAEGNVRNLIITVE